MSDKGTSEDEIEWSRTTWKGSRSEQLRRWSELSFDEILEPQEEMAELAKIFGATPFASRVTDK